MNDCRWILLHHTKSNTYGIHEQLEPGVYSQPITGHLIDLQELRDELDELAAASKLEPVEL